MDKGCRGYLGCRKRWDVIVGKSSDDNDLDNNDDEEEERMLVSRYIFSVAGDPDVGLMQCSIFLPTNSNYNDDCVNIANELLFTFYDYI